MTPDSSMVLVPMPIHCCVGSKMMRSMVAQRYSSTRWSRW
jgi:hypothetical protein